MRKLYARMFLTTAACYVVVYVFYSFTVWEIVNPFKWILDMPKYENLTRFMILFYWILFWAINWKVNTEILK